MSVVPSQQQSPAAHVRTALLDLLNQAQPGDRLPAERDLALRFGVARMTLRRHLDQLQAEGRLRRLPKRGSFVTEHKLTHSLTMASFTEEVRAQGQRPSSRMVSVAEQYAGPRISAFLEVDADARLWRLERLRLADDVPVSLETVYVPQRLVPGFTPDLLTDHSWYEMLSNEYDIHVVSGQQTIEPTVTDENESILLGVGLHSPAFLFERTCRDRRGRPVEHVRAVTRGDRYRIQCRLALAGPGDVAADADA